MNNLVILAIFIGFLLLFFLILLFFVSKSKISESIIPIENSKQLISDSLRQKWKIYKQMIDYIKTNLSIKEDAFQNFLDFMVKECKQEDLIKLLDETTFEINKYVDNYEELNKAKDFVKLKRSLYHIQMELEAMIEYYNNKIDYYNDLKDNGPTKIATKIYEFENFDKLKLDKKEISRLTDLN